MKTYLRTLVARILAELARQVIRKYKPRVIMVTGSVGKTSTKDAVAATLKGQGYVRASEKSYNSEFGVPLTILGAANPWLHFSSWGKVLIEGVLLLLLKNKYPHTLVLEVGADSPGDLRKILRIATPNAVVVTKLPDVPVHVEAYATPDAVREEEFTPAYALAPGAPLIISADDQHAKKLAAPLSSTCTTYGFSLGADVRVLGEQPLVESGELVGMQATISVHGVEQVFHVRGAIGRPQLLAPAAALALATALGIPLKKALIGANTYTPPAGRGRILQGVNDTTLIDDSYNASPTAVQEAIDSLILATTVIPGSRSVAVLGDMLELGRYSADEHEKIGRYAAPHISLLVTVGTRSKATYDAAIAAGMSPDNVIQVDSSTEVPDLLMPHIQPKDIILVKGSQSIRMERVLEKLLAKESDRYQLVRQEGEWKKR